jgi:peptidoglycan hydrolase CwlO-like protein
VKDIAIVLLSLVLAAAIISGLILYQRHRDTKDSLLISEENLSGLNENVSQLGQENSALRDQIHKNAKRHKELDSTQGRISELETVIRMKDQIISESEESAQGAQSHIRYLEEQEMC